MPKAKTIKTRILRDETVGGVKYRANQVVAFPEDDVKSLEKDGAVDSSAAAVAFALKNGAEDLVHDPESDEPTGGTLDSSKT